MKTIYFFDGQGKKVNVKVSDEVAAEYKKIRQEEWRQDAYERYYTQSLDRIAESGHEFADGNSDLEQQYLDKLDEAQKQRLLRKLRKVLLTLTEVQRTTIHKLHVLKMSQADIAREEGVLRCTIKERVDAIYEKLKNYLDN